jgi:hypothetical protein
MAKYRKKPVVIEAIQFREGNFEEILNFSSGKAKRRISYEGNAPIETNTIDIQTLEGTMNAIDGDFIIKGVSGEFYPCKPDIFEKTYEKVD